METAQKTTEEKRQDYLKKVVVNPKDMSGVWRVTIEINNSEGQRAFGGRLLTAYDHPLSGETAFLVNLNGKIELGWNIDKPDMILKPDENKMDRRIVDWLIAHPEVGVEGLDLTNTGKRFKVSNPQIKMVNIDKQEMTEIDNQDTIDYVIGKLSDPNPKTGISLERFRYLLAHFNLTYYNMKFITNKESEKKWLRNRMKDFARTTGSDGELNAVKINDVLTEIDNFKFDYEFKELLRFDIVKQSNGMFKFNNVPIGTSLESGIDFMKSNPEIYVEMVDLLYPKLKAEGFQFK